MNAPEQLTLLSEPRVRHDSPDSSRDAAVVVKPSHQNRLTRIAQMVDDAGYMGCTADEVWQRAVLEDGKATRSTWHSATAAAVKAGLIVPRGRLHVRLSIHNCAMQIYVSERHRDKP